MSTVDKALSLLSYFSLTHHSWGLSELARVSGNDKATTHRLLQSLSNHKMIEQDSDTRKYRIGSAFLSLARIREESFPLSSVLNNHLKRIADVTGETSHASIPSKNAMSTIGVSEPKRSTRVYVDPSQSLPFHATAPGITLLAFGTRDVAEKCKAVSKLDRYTKNTPVDWSSVSKLIKSTRKKGFSIAPEFFEDEAVGIAVPIFDSHGFAQASLAVVAPTMRITGTLKKKIIQELINTTISASLELGVQVPQFYQSIAERHLK